MSLLGAQIVNTVGKPGHVPAQLGCLPRGPHRPEFAARLFFHYLQAVMVNVSVTLPKNKNISRNSRLITQVCASLGPEQSAGWEENC